MVISAQAKAALSTLKGLEAPEAIALAATLESELETVDVKNFTVIGEKRTETARKQALEAALTEVGKALGLDGDLDALLTDVAVKAKLIATERDVALTAKNELATKSAAAESELSTLKTESQRRAIAEKAGVDFQVFSDLFNADDLAKFSTDKETLEYDGKPFREHVLADERLKRYESALFRTEELRKPVAPGAPPSGKPIEKTDPFSAYMETAYGAGRQT